MNKKQICKVNYEKKYVDETSKHQMYGICVGDNEFLLETGYILNTEAPLIYSPFEVLRSGKEPSQYRGTRITAASASATRNVPADIREYMEEAYTAFTNAMTATKKFLKIREMYDKEMAGYDKTLNALPTEIKHCRGILDQNEFLEAFLAALPDTVTKAMKEQPKTNYWGNKSGDYSCSIYGKQIVLSTDVEIQKYFRESSFTYQEYDGSIMLTDDAKKQPAYQKYISKYSHPLPIKTPLSDEYLSVGGDKDFLIYQAEYCIEIKKAMTKEYAQELADDFCGIKRQKNLQEDVQRDENMERD